MPAGVASYRSAPRPPERVIDVSRLVARFGNVVTLFCILTVGILHFQLQQARAAQDKDRAAMAAERDALRSKLATLTADKTRVDDAMRTIGPQGLGIPPMAPSEILRAIRNRLGTIRLDRVSYIPAATAGHAPEIQLEVTAPSGRALVEAVARLGESPFRNPTVSTDERDGTIAARITLEAAGSDAQS